jgi:hypothetical protein
MLNEKSHLTSLSEIIRRLWRGRLLVISAFVAVAGILYVQHRFSGDLYTQSVGVSVHCDEPVRLFMDPLSLALREASPAAWEVSVAAIPPASPRQEVRIAFNRTLRLTASTLPVVTDLEKGLLSAWVKAVFNGRGFQPVDPAYAANQIQGLRDEEGLLQRLGNLPVPETPVLFTAGAPEDWLPVPLHLKVVRLRIMREEQTLSRNEANRRLWRAVDATVAQIGMASGLPWRQLALSNAVLQGVEPDLARRFAESCDYIDRAKSGMKVVVVRKSWAKTFAAILALALGLSLASPFALDYARNLFRGRQANGDAN